MDAADFHGCKDAAPSRLQTEMQEAPAPPLTPAQEGFAREHHATAGTRNALGVFMYRTEPYRTERWLVGPNGQILDELTFHG
jgi:hypothetical protein